LEELCEFQASLLTQKGRKEGRKEGSKKERKKERKKGRKEGRKNTSTYKANPAVNHMHVHKNK